MVSDLLFLASGWGDLNSRPLDPQSSALTKLRHSPLLNFLVGGHISQDQHYSDPVSQLRNCKRHRKGIEVYPAVARRPLWRFGERPRGEIGP
jgi:hypothetical protein